LLRSSFEEFAQDPHLHNDQSMGRSYHHIVPVPNKHDASVAGQTKQDPPLKDREG
jgi:hypothetical protein